MSRNHWLRYLRQQSRFPLCTSQQSAWLAYQKSLRSLGCRISSDQVTYLTFLSQSFMSRLICLSCKGSWPSLYYYKCMLCALSLEFIGNLLQGTYTFSLGFRFKIMLWRHRCPFDTWLTNRLLRSCNYCRLLMWWHWASAPSPQSHSSKRLSFFVQWTKTQSLALPWWTRCFENHNPSS
jgi:hypothetical protein